jgi:Ser/Thr protein kinase RdoA (MazF antagonist)
MGGGRATLLDAWGEAIAAYERVRPLTPDERAAVPFLHATSVILGLDNWFRWTVEERRHFSAPERACARIDRLTAGLGAAIEQTIDAAANLN